MTLIIYAAFSDSLRSVNWKKSESFPLQNSSKRVDFPIVLRPYRAYVFNPGCAYSASSSSNSVLRPMNPGMSSTSGCLILYAF